MQQNNDSEKLRFHDVSLLKRWRLQQAECDVVHDELWSSV